MDHDQIESYLQSVHTKNELITSNTFIEGLGKLLSIWTSLIKTLDQMLSNPMWAHS